MKLVHCTGVSTLTLLRPILLLFTVYTLSTHWRQQEFSLGAMDQGTWGRKPPSKVQGQRPGRRSEGLCPPETEAVCRHGLQVLTVEMIKI